MSMFLKKKEMRAKIMKLNVTRLKFDRARIINV